MAEIPVPKEAISPKGPEQGRKSGEVKETPTKEQTEGRSRSEEIRQKTMSNRRFFEAAAGEHPDHTIETPPNEKDSGIDRMTSDIKEPANETADTIKPLETKPEGALAEVSSDNSDIGAKRVKNEKPVETKSEAGVLKSGSEISSGNTGSGVEEVKDEIPLESGGNKEIPIHEQIRIEEEKLHRWFYGDSSLKIDKYIHDARNESTRIIEGIIKSGKSVDKKDLKEKDMNYYALKALKTANSQMDRLAPEKFNRELEPSDPRYPIVPLKDQKIPIYMVQIAKDGTFDYNPNNKPSLFRGESDWMFGGALKKPKKEVVQQLQDYYAKVKEAGEKKSG